MILEVKEARYIENYMLELKFNNGTIRTIDLKDELDGEIFEPLKDINFFKSFYIDCQTVSWSNGADIAPEYLYFKSKAKYENDTLDDEIFRTVAENYNLKGEK